MLKPGFSLSFHFTSGLSFVSCHDRFKQLLHYSYIFSRNAPKVLATLFLLYYAKLLRAVITVFSFTFLDYPDGTTKALWLYDGNVAFLRGKHIPLFMFACIVCLAFLLPYMVIVIFAQCLQRINSYRVQNVLRRLKPTIHAHVRPYKDKYRSWPGLLLLTRVYSALPCFCLKLTGRCKPQPASDNHSSSGSHLFGTCIVWNV